MKKLFIFTILFLGITMLLDTKMVYAEDTNYHAYEEIILNDGQLLEDWSDEQYKGYLKKLKRKFFGWRIYYVVKNAKVKYRSDIKLAIYNDGVTPIVHTYQNTSNTTTKRGTSVKGGSGLSGKASNKKLSGGLEAKIEGSFTESKSYSSEETWKIDFSVDPQTKILIYTEGTAKLTNGVASNYQFWCRGKYGAFEIFVITSQYTKIEKVRIR